jgi:hypothetical protein
VRKAEPLIRRGSVVFLDVFPEPDESVLEVTMELESLGCIVKSREGGLTAFPRSKVASWSDTTGEMARGEGGKKSSLARIAHVKYEFALAL